MCDCSVVLFDAAALLFYVVPLHRMRASVGHSRWQNPLCVRHSPASFIFLFKWHLVGLNCIFDFTSLRNFLPLKNQNHSVLLFRDLIAAPLQMLFVRENTMHLPHGDNCVRVGEWNRWRDFHGQKAAERCAAECRGLRKTWLSPVRLGFACDSGHFPTLTQDVRAWNYLGRSLMVSLMATNGKRASRVAKSSPDPCKCREALKLCAQDKNIMEVGHFRHYTC